VKKNYNKQTTKQTSHEWFSSHEWFLALSS